MANAVGAIHSRVYRVDIDAFRRAFQRVFPGRSIFQPEDELWNPMVMSQRDLCPDVKGMLSLRKQRLLNLAFATLPEGEAYLEVGTYMGKSLLSAMLGNAPRPVHAVDSFSEFTDVNSLETTLDNLRRYGLVEQVHFHDCDFRAVFDKSHIPEPVGLYFYDGAHDEQSQYDGIRMVEPLLADSALVLVDDWRLAEDSGSYAEIGTLGAMADSRHDWRLLYHLPARMNGDLGLWWNGVGVLSFRRIHADEGAFI